MNPSEAAAARADATGCTCGGQSLHEKSCAKVLARLNPPPRLDDDDELARARHDEALNAGWMTPTVGPTERDSS